MRAKKGAVNMSVLASAASSEQKSNAKWKKFAFPVGVPAAVFLGFGVWFLFVAKSPGSPASVAFPWGEAVQWAFSAFLFVMMLQPLLSGAAWPHWRVFRLFRPLVAVQCFLLVAATLGTALALSAAFPFLNWSWMHLIPGDENKSMNLLLLPVRLPLIGPVFCVLFGCNIPSLAHQEERDFRQNTRNWKHAAFRSVRFGLAHCWMGVPIFAGLALILSGLWYSRQYFAGGVERSTLHHATYNLIVLGIVFALLVSGYF